MRTIKDEIKKVKQLGFTVESGEKKTIDIIPSEAEIEIKSHLYDVSSSIYHKPIKYRPHYLRHGKVKITEVKKIMKPVDKETISYKILDMAVKYDQVSVKLLQKKLNEAAITPVAASSIMSPLVRFVKAGVMKKRVTQEGRIKVVWYYVSEADKKLGTDALYAMYRSATKKPTPPPYGKEGKSPRVVTPGLKDKLRDAIQDVLGVKVEISGSIEIVFKLG